MKLFDELKKYCNNNGIRLQIDVFRKDKNRYELTFDNYSPEELKNIRNIISDYAKIEDDVYLAGNGRAIDIYFETLDESKKSARKSLKESNFKKSDAKVALHNVLRNGEEFDIPFKYSDECEFTDAIEDELEKQAFEFEGSFWDKNYGLVHEYSDGLETVYAIIDRSLSSRGICVGLVTEL